MRQANLLAKIYHTTVGDNLKLWILDRPVSLLYVSQYYRKINWIQDFLSYHNNSCYHIYAARQFEYVVTRQANWIAKKNHITTARQLESVNTWTYFWFAKRNQTIAERQRETVDTRQTIILANMYHTITAVQHETVNILQSSWHSKMKDTAVRQIDSMNTRPGHWRTKSITILLKDNLKTWILHWPVCIIKGITVLLQDHWISGYSTGVLAF